MESLKSPAIADTRNLALKAPPMGEDRQWRDMSSHARAKGPRALEIGRRPPLDSPPTGGSGDGGRYSTKLAAGLRSVARNNKATRLLTRPGQATKSSAKDSILRAVKLQYAGEQPRVVRGCRCRPA
jgi:hypothetical protein